MLRGWKKTSPPATSTDSVSAVLFVGLASCLSVPLPAEGLGGQYTSENAGRDDLGSFSTPILLNRSCSKKRSKSSRPHFPNAGLGSVSWSHLNKKNASLIILRVVSALAGGRARKGGKAGKVEKMDVVASSTAQGGGGSFKNRKRIGEIHCCE